MTFEGDAELYWKIWFHPKVTHKLRATINSHMFTDKELELILRQLDKPKPRKQASKQARTTHR